MERGHTLLELSVALALAAVAATSFLGATRGLRERAAVISAREALAGLFAEARVAAVASGGATVHVRSAPAEAWYEAAGTERRRIRLGRDEGVSVTLNRGRTASDLRYDPLGLGQVASETFRLRRGKAEATLVVSGYGRVRRW
jgi:prepilin-type N-terminal cleavage/methylation domain-containing protein